MSALFFISGGLFTKMPHPVNIRRKRNKKRIIEIYLLINLGFIYNLEVSWPMMRNRMPTQISNRNNCMVTIYWTIFWMIPSDIPSIQLRWVLPMISKSVKFFQYRSPPVLISPPTTWKAIRTAPINNEASPANVNFDIIRSPYIVGSRLSFTLKTWSSGPVFLLWFISHKHATFSAWFFD